MCSYKRKLISVNIQQTTVFTSSVNYKLYIQTFTLESTMLDYHFHQITYQMIRCILFPALLAEKGVSTHNQMQINSKLRLDHLKKR